MKKMILKAARIQESCGQLFALKPGWAEEIPLLVRFLLLALGSFFTYGIYKALGGLRLEKINRILESYLTEPGAFIVGSYILIWGLLGLYSTLITAALIKSLVPRP